MDRRDFIKSAMMAGAVAAMPLAARAQGGAVLRVGITVAPTSLDPHFHDSFTSTQALLQIYQPLLGQDDTSALIPWLATDWTATDDLTWEITLRQGVTFHDGTPLEPEDVIFSFQRVPNVEGAAAPFTANVRDIAKMEVLDGNRVRFTLKAPDPLFSYKLGQVCILSRKIHADVTLADFNSGKVAIGTGPYAVDSFVPGEGLKLRGNPTYWGGAPDWDKVDIRYMSDPGTRVASLRAGEVDLIDNVPVQDIDGLKSDSEITLFSQDAFLIVYLGIDSQREVTPFVTDTAGAPLKTNPLRDARVRKALSLAIDRTGFVNRMLSGQGTPADQFSGVLVPDRAPDMPALVLDVAQAKALLADAGYPDGFRMTIHGPNGWFASDANILQGLAQSFSRIGVATTVEVLPTAMLQTNARKKTYSMHLAAFNGAFSLIALRYAAMTPDPATGNGVSNLYGYTNPTVDTAMTAALVEMDTDKRKALLAQAMHALIDDMGLIPVLFTKTNWAGRTGNVVYHGNPMSRTSAFYAKRA